VAGLVRLLVVDDDRELQRMVQRYADKVGGYVIEQALDGEGGLEAARARRPDLILLDVSMPRMDGRDLLKRLKADPALADIPVIMFSARSEQSDRLVGLELGADDYIEKPFHFEMLFRRIAHRIEKARGAG